MPDLPPRTAPLLAAVVLGAVAGAAPPGAPGTDPWGDWHVLELRVRDAPMLRGEVEMRIEEGADERRFETRTTARLFGASVARSRTVSTLDRATGRPKEFVSYSRKRARRYRFGERTYSVEKLGPPAGAGEVPHEKDWEVLSRIEFEYPLAEDGQTPLAVFDYIGMLLHLRDVQLEGLGDEVTLYLATTNGPRAYRILVAERRSAKRVYTDLASGMRVTVPTTESRLRITPRDPEQAGEGFLALEGEIELWVESGSRTLLELNGKVPRIPGRIRLLLSAIG